MKHKKEPPRNGSSEGGKAINAIGILTHAAAFVKDEETWSEALDYWCRRDDDEPSDNC